MKTEITDFYLNCVHEKFTRTGNLIIISTEETLLSDQVGKAPFWLDGRRVVK